MIGNVGSKGLFLPPKSGHDLHRSMTVSGTAGVNRLLGELEEFAGEEEVRESNPGCGRRFVHFELKSVIYHCETYVSLYTYRIC
jgi:hypothetical protein